MARILPATPEAVQQAAAALRSGQLVAFPTETVYGLGAAALDPQAVARIYELKGRPKAHPLIVH
ncbi:MAG: Sua5/YciO/YrdC/YwlC family protein, partial [Trueperaceae bacterium]